MVLPVCTAGASFADSPARAAGASFADSSARAAGASFADSPACDAVVSSVCAAVVLPVCTAGALFSSARAAGASFADSPACDAVVSPACAAVVLPVCTAGASFTDSPACDAVVSSVCAAVVLPVCTAGASFADSPARAAGALIAACDAPPTSGCAASLSKSCPSVPDCAAGASSMRAAPGSPARAAPGISVRVLPPTADFSACAAPGTVDGVSAAFFKISPACAAVGSSACALPGASSAVASVFSHSIRIRPFSCSLSARGGSRGNILKDFARPPRAVRGGLRGCFSKPGFCQRPRRIAPRPPARPVPHSSAPCRVLPLAPCRHGGRVCLRSAGARIPPDCINNGARVRASSLRRRASVSDRAAAVWNFFRPRRCGVSEPPRQSGLPPPRSHSTACAAACKMLLFY